MPSVIFATAQGTGGGFGGAGGAAGRGGPPPLAAKLFKSTDEGRTWTEVTTLPRYPGRISVAVAMHTNGHPSGVAGLDTCARDGWRSALPRCRYGCDVAGLAASLWTIAT
jgi:hypothetical protein